MIELFPFQSMLLYLDKQKKLGSWNYNLVGPVCNILKFPFILNKLCSNLTLYEENLQCVDNQL